MRPGYTEASYRALLEPVGFSVSPAVGLGGGARQAWNRRITHAQQALGIVGGMALFTLATPFLPFLSENRGPPYSLYVQAMRPEVQP